LRVKIRMIFRIFSLTEEIFFGATQTAAVSAAVAKRRPPLAERYHTDAGLL
jgi:hypothetical protein